MPIESLSQNGFYIEESVFDSDVISTVIGQLESGLSKSSAAITGRSGNIAAARNILTELPDANKLWQHSRLVELLETVLGLSLIHI